MANPASHTCRTQVTYTGVRQEGAVVKEAGSVAQLPPFGAERTHANSCTSLSLFLLWPIGITAALTSQLEWGQDELTVSLVTAQEVLTYSLACSTQSVNKSRCYHTMVMSFDQNTLGDKLGRNIPSCPFYR